MGCYPTFFQSGAPGGSPFIYPEVEILCIVYTHTSRIFKLTLLVHCDQPLQAKKNFNNMNSRSEERRAGHDDQNFKDHENGPYGLEWQPILI